MVLTAPLIAIVEAKNDNIHNGLGQCIAAMFAAWEFNQQGEHPCKDRLRRRDHRQRLEVHATAKY